MRILILLIVLLFSTTGCEVKNYKFKGATPTTSNLPDKNIDIALVLSGAGSKGIVHAGVIAALEEKNIKIDLLVGSSAGALVGLLYSDSHNIQKVKEILLNSQPSDFFTGSPSSNFIQATLFGRAAKLNKFEKFIDKNVSSKNFEELKTPLAIVTTDITNNKSQVYNSGPFKAAVISSCSIPGLLRPITFNDAVHVDGGVISPVPTSEAQKFKPRVTIAVNLVAKPPKEKINNNFELLYRSSWITYYELAKMEQEKADISLNIDTSDVDWLDNLSQHEKNKLFQRGYDAAIKLINKNGHILKK